jgi:hypothetical protein
MDFNVNVSNLSNMSNLLGLANAANRLDEKANRRHRGSSALATFLRGGVPQNGYISGQLEGANKIVYGMEDPTYLAFQLIVDTSNGLFRTVQSSTSQTIEDLSKNDYNYTAIEYLKACEHAREEYYQSAGLSGARRNTRGNITSARVNLERFVAGFSDISKKYPYYFQTIEGLQDVYKKYYNNEKDPFLGGNDTLVKVSCLESLDLRMTALFDSYFKAVYDRQYRRMMIPYNLLQFNCTVIIHDLRRLVCYSNSDYKTSIDNWKDVEQNTSMIIFRFKNCVFDADLVGESIATMSNADKTEAKASFQFKYDDVQIDVCSLADMLQDKKVDTNLKAIRDVTDQNVYAAQHSDTHELVTTTEKDMGYENIYQDSKGKGLFGTLFNTGRQVFGAATSSSSMGNVYSEGAIGYLDNMFNSIGVGGFGSYAKGEGKQVMRSMGEKLFGGTDENGQRSFMNKLTNSGHFNI